MYPVQFAPPRVRLDLALEVDVVAVLDVVGGERGAQHQRDGGRICVGRRETCFYVRIGLIDCRILFFLQFCCKVRFLSAHIKMIIISVTDQIYMM